MRAKKITGAFEQLVMRAGLIAMVKVIGTIGKMFLFRVLGAEGTGLFQMAYALFGLLITLATGGFSTALTFFTASNARVGERLLHVILPIVAFLACVGALLTYVYAPEISSWMGNQDLIIPLRFLLPALIIVPVLNLIRGYLQGMERYRSIAVSELVEQTVRIVGMILLATFLLDAGLTKAVGGAVAAAAIGALGAFLFLLPALRRSFSEDTDSFGRDLRLVGKLPVGGVFRMAMAILATRIILPLHDFLDSLIIPNRLIQGGMSEVEAATVFGEYIGMVSTIVYTPTLITAALSHIMAAKLASDWERGRLPSFHQRVRKALSAGAWWGLLASTGLFLCGPTLSYLVYGNTSLGGEIRSLALLPLLCGIRELTTTILWTANNKNGPILGLLFASFASTGVTYVVVGIPEWSLAGIIWGMVAFEVVGAAANLLMIHRIKR
ncbi:oligosaccharide flippase family protein [Brevibacillus ruminantium]|uniref:Oligosaccharide flippase family protein n=1 Tax=Brevibacillus ruminantium TaxID=2950604 RepID=A0ABY4WDZ7_9BACL|nr:oligosaccharide flippase family protein [Brevibacillus ruminantium]USG65283.1 oligosaccharide flippase family protein [Brevibacillus ruminantium]